MRVIILGSGQGSNCKAILEASASNLLHSAEIVAVCSDVEASGILEIARNASVQSLFLGPYSLKNKGVDEAWIKEIKSFSPDLIVLAGFMKVLSTQFINSFDGKIINLHPSLLPSFQGLDAIQQAWDAGVKITGCTVHWVSPVLDSGEIIAQSPVRIMQGDTIESVSAKVHAAEHMLLPSVIAQLAMQLN